YVFFFFSSRRRHTRSKRDWSSDVCSSDLPGHGVYRCGWVEPACLLRRFLSCHGVIRTRTWTGTSPYEGKRGVVVSSADGPERGIQTKEGRRPGCLCPESEGSRASRTDGA